LLLIKVLITLLALLSVNLVVTRAQTESEAELPAVQQLQAVDLTVYQTEEARQGAVPWVLIGITRSYRDIRTFQIPAVVLPAGLFRLTEVNFTLWTPEDLSPLRPVNLT